MKTLKLLLVAVLLCVLTGCSYSANYIDPEDRRIVTSVGIIKQSDTIICVVEAPDIQNSSSEKPKIYKGAGKNLRESFNNAVNKISGETIFSHCPLILLDDSVKNDALQQVFDLCLSHYDFSLSIQLLNCDVLGVYDKKTVNNSVGYEILKTVNYTEKDLKIDEYGRFARILSDNINSREFKIPHLVLSDDSVEIDGFSVYKNNSKANFIDIRVVEDGNS